MTEPAADSRLVFADERPTWVQTADPAPWKVMIIDDEPSVHDITRTVLNDFTYDRRGLFLLDAFSAAEAIEMINQHTDTALLLVDVVMEAETSGLDLVRHVRETLQNNVIQIAIRTGQPGQAPEADVVSRYKIDTYSAKTEMTAQKLISLVTTSLRTYQLSRNLEVELAKRVKAETNLRRLNQELEERVAKRTAQLKESNQKMQQMAQKANEASEAKSTFLANMSHEIRTPLNGIIGMIKVLQKENLTPAQQNYAEIIGESADALLGIINDILDFSKIEAGEVRLEPRYFSPSAVLDNIAALLQVKADEKKIDLIRGCTADVPACLYGDPGKFRQILLNLAGNAVKFTEQGHVRIFLSCQSLGPGKLELTAVIEDTGPGIPASFRHNLFDKFSQADASITRQYGGTGLGLAISRQLSDLMGGRITVNSTAGKGSTFTVTLPFDLASEPRCGPVPDPSSASDAPDGKTREVPDDIRLLLAEDNPVNQKVALIMLSQKGISADVAENGLEVLEALRKKSYDLILMDIQMPRMDGYETARIIRDPASDIGLKSIPIVAMTAHALKAEHQKCLDAGMNAVLTKPITPDQLLQSLKEVLAAHA